ncbi:MAG: nucleoside recognition domain-containing protein [Clostridiales bacterium]|nr:nucleoside recognition domain-containing protein [Clostridiales bacterium]
MHRKIYELLGMLAVLGCAAALVCFPKEAVKAASDGLTLCLNVIIPSLFPFFVISTLAVDLGLAARIGRLIEPLMRRLFNVSGACAAAFVLGFVGGYPVGARTAISLYERGECSRREAERLLSFCNNSGPAFILGVVGTSVFSDNRVGLLLYLVHGIASVMTGILFRRWKGGSDMTRPKLRQSSAVRPSFAAAFTEGVKSSFASTLNICGFVIFFTVLIKMLFLSGILPFLADAVAFALSPLGVDGDMARRLLTGVIELSSGVWSLSGAAESLSAGAAMAAFMLGWAGISVHCQTLSFLCDSGLSAKTYIIGKLIHGILSAALVWLAFDILPFEEAAAAYLARQVSGIAELSFAASLTISLLCALALAALVIIFAAISEKRVEKEEKV